MPAPFFTRLRSAEWDLYQQNFSGLTLTDIIYTTRLTRSST